MISFWVKRRELDRNTGIRVLDFYPHNPLVAGSSPAGPTFHFTCPPQRTHKSTGGNSYTHTHRVRMDKNGRIT